MGFFVTSVGLGKGANLGGLAGADAHCQALAMAAGQGTRTWRAYLSTTAAGAQAAVNARDRIGNGPWYNARGTLIANNVADLHGDVQRDRNTIMKDTALNEKGAVVSGRGDQPNQHDMLTGSDSTGRALPGDANTQTCGNWTSDGPAGDDIAFAGGLRRRVEVAAPGRSALPDRARRASVPGHSRNCSRRYHRLSRVQWR